MCIFLWKGNGNHDLGTGFFVHKIITAVERVEFVSGRIPHIILRGRWCDIIVLNVHAPTEDAIHMIDKFYKELKHVFNKSLKYHKKILLADFSAKVGKEDVFKPTIGNESLQEILNDNGVRAVNFAQSKNVNAKVRFSQNITLINLLRHNLMESCTTKLTTF
jgi:DNA-directed RNA polymerase subunit L